jgi:hypothetical protein
MASLISVVIGSLVFGALFALAVLEARAEETLWSKCGQGKSRRRMQQQITLGKSHAR